MTTRILTGHVMDRLAELPDESVHCVVCSPPYFGLRSYGTEPQVWGGDPGCEHERGHPITTEHAFCLHCNAWRGSLGLEPSPELYIAHLVEVFREVRRVLRSDGVMFVNIGDSYSNDGKWGGSSGGKHVKALHGQTGVGRTRQTTGLKPKDLIGVPWMLAFALRGDGWWLRSEIIWAKKAPMPESVTDRPTSAHEKVFLLTRSPRYFYDAEAVKEEAAEDSGWAKQRANGENTWKYNDTPERLAATGQRIEGSTLGTAGKRNMRNWWLLGPEPFPEAHFAVFPTEIPRICIKAGTSERGVCPKCGAPWERIVDRGASPKASERVQRLAASQVSRTGGAKTGGTNSSTFGIPATEMPTQKTIGWRPTCSCDAGVPIPATCLDPFLGAGTTSLVADQLGRDCIGIELNSSYAKMAENRLRDDAGMFVSIAAE